MKIGDKIKITDESKSEYNEVGQVVGLQAGVEHLLVSVMLDKGGQRLFTACSLSSGGCSCGQALKANKASSGGFL